jgi:hypothetical protein
MACNIRPEFEQHTAGGTFAGDRKGALKNEADPLIG